MRLQYVCFRLLFFLFWTLCSNGTTCSPSSQRSESLLCAFPQCKLCLRILTYLLGVAEIVDCIVQFAQRLLCGSINFSALGVSQVSGVFLCRIRGAARSRKLLPSRGVRSREVALPYRFEVIVEFGDVRALLLSAMSVGALKMRNVAYNAVCLLQELV